MSEQTHPEVIERVFDHLKVSYRLHHRPGDHPGALRVIEDQAHYLKRRCDYIASDPCARFPGCLCGLQIVEHVLLELWGRIDPPISHRSALASPSDPPPRTTPPAPPRKRPAVAMPIPRPLDFTDARGEAWEGDRKMKRK